MSERFQTAIETFVLDEGVVERLSRGVYRLTSLPSLEAPDLVAVATRVPDGVVCLISALAFHEMTTQIPRAVDIAIARGAEPPRIDYPPVHVYWFSGKAFTEGIETPKVDGVQLRVYCPEKTVADVFKYRSKLGLDVALEALRAWQQKRTSNVDKVLHYARICRVERVVRPYLEAIT